MTHPAENDARLANLCCGHAACQREVRERMAQAWDQGEAAGSEYESRRVSDDPDDWEGLVLPTNPYRVTPPGSGHEHAWVEGEVTSGPTMIGERLTVCAICGTTRPTPPDEGTP